MRGGHRTTAKETHSGPDHLQLVEQTDLRADHHADQGAHPDWRTPAGAEAALDPRARQRAAHQRDHHQTGVYGSGGPGVHRNRAGQGQLRHRRQRRTAARGAPSPDRAATHAAGR